MGGREIEPRKTVWALAEVCWREPDGTSSYAPATLEDTSASGACVRVKRRFAIGSRLTIKWRREQFSAIAKNCRSEGRDFLLGVCREGAATQEMPHTKLPDVSSRSTDIANAPVQEVEQAKLPGAPTSLSPSPSTTLRREQGGRNVAQGGSTSPLEQLRPENRTRLPVPVAKSPPVRPASAIHEIDLRSGSERKVMQPKSLIPQFWRRQQDEDAPAKTTSTEAQVTKTTNQGAEHAGIAHAELLSYEDIYRAAGIMGAGSGYDIHKVVDMLNSERIRDLSQDVKRASVLMALDAAGIAVNDLLTDATRRQNALNSYEAAERKQLDDFEAQKAQENARIEGNGEDPRPLRGTHPEKSRSGCEGKGVAAQLAERHAARESADRRSDRSMRQAGSPAPERYGGGGWIAGRGGQAERRS
jgi:hypothetical protein